jgi:hypothetical protein
MFPGICENLTDFFDDVMMSFFTDGEEIKLRHWKKYEDLVAGGDNKYLKDHNMKAY